MMRTGPPRSVKTTITKAARHPAGQNETVLVVFLALILPNEGKRILKSANHVLETDTVLFVFGSSCCPIPFKAIMVY
jgi:hypothetical protein